MLGTETTTQDNQPDRNRIIELPHQEQLKKQMFIIKDGKFYRPNVLEKCFDRGSIQQDQYLAGLQLFTDAYMGLILAGLKGMDPTKAAMPRQKGYKPPEMTTDQAWAHRSWSDAYHHDSIGNEERRVLWHIVILDQSISSYADDRNHTIGTLRTALNELVRHYRIRKII